MTPHDLGLDLRDIRNKLKEEKVRRKIAEKEVKRLQKLVKQLQKFVSLVSPRKVEALKKELRTAQHQVGKLGEKLHAKDLEIAALRQRTTPNPPGLSPRASIPSKNVCIRAKQRKKLLRKKVTPKAQAVVQIQPLNGTKVLFTTSDGTTESVPIESVAPEDVLEAYIE